MATNGNGHGNGDVGDVFGFSKPSYDRKTVAAMPVDRHAMFYNMSHKRRGTAIIFNHERFGIEKLRDRSGTDVDAKNLKLTLEMFGFDVKLHEDLNHREMKRLIDKEATADHSDCDCFMLVVLTHGEMGILYARDTAYKPESLWAPFSGSNCPTLAGKPKLFFIQACQGDSLDGGIALRRTETDGCQSYKIPNFADFLIAYSTIPGYFSWRNTTKGSWFIQALCIELQERGEDLDLLALLTMVSQRVAIDFESNTPADKTMHQQKQIPCITSMLIRLIRLNKVQRAV